MGSLISVAFLIILELLKCSGKAVGTWLTRLELESRQARKIFPLLADYHPWEQLMANPGRDEFTRIQFTVLLQNFALDTCVQLIGKVRYMKFSVRRFNVWRAEWNRDRRF